MKKVLLIEDDEHLAELLTLDVEELGFSLDVATNGTDGLEKALSGQYELLLLDLHLPDMEGVEVCKRIRSENTVLPIIVITARADDLSKVLLIELGADDYLTKPYNALELKARIKAVLRRSARGEVGAAGGGEESASSFSYKGLHIDFEKRRVTINDEPIELTARQFDILKVLASKPGRPFSRSELTNAVYGYDVVGYDVSVSSHINRLRSKIEPNPEEPIYVITVRGVGYCMSDASEGRSEDTSE